MLFLISHIINGILAKIPNSEIVLVRSPSELVPAYNICAARNLRPIVATEENYEYLVNKLKSSSIASAAVDGWNDVIQALVIKSTGSISYFNSNTNDTLYAFCTGSVPASLPTDTITPDSNDTSNSRRGGILQINKPNTTIIIDSSSESHTNCERKNSHHHNPKPLASKPVKLTIDVKTKGVEHKSHKRRN